MANKAYASRLKQTSLTDDANGYDILGHLRDAGTFIATGQMPVRTSAVTSSTNPLDDEIKRQRLLTGSPDFQIKLAQTKADAELQNRLAADEAAINAKRQRQLGMGGQHGQFSSGQSFGFQPSQAPALVQGNSPLGQMGGSQGPKMLMAVPKIDPDTGVSIPEYQLADNPEYLDPEQRQKMADAEQTKKLQAEQARAAGLSMLQALQGAEKGLDFFGGYGDMPTTTPFGTPNPLVTTNYQGKRGERADWEANLSNLESQKMIDTIMKMKEASATGATGFGQLSEKEGQVLRQASMKLRRNLDSKDAQKYITQMKEIQKKALGMPFNQAIIDQAILEEQGISAPTSSQATPQSTNYKQKYGLE